MGRSTHKAETSPAPIKRRSPKNPRQVRKRATARPTTKFTIQYFRTGKRTKPLTFDLPSFERARKLARIAGDFPDLGVHAFTITSERGRTETWLFREGTWLQNRDEQ